MKTLRALQMLSPAMHLRRLKHPQTLFANPLTRSLTHTHKQPDCHAPSISSSDFPLVVLLADLKFVCLRVWLLGCLLACLLAWLLGCCTTGQQPSCTLGQHQLRRQWSRQGKVGIGFRISAGHGQPLSVPECTQVPHTTVVCRVVVRAVCCSSIL